MTSYYWDFSTPLRFGRNDIGIVVSVVRSVNDILNINLTKAFAGVWGESQPPTLLFLFLARKESTLSLWIILTLYLFGSTYRIFYTQGSSKPKFVYFLLYYKSWFAYEIPKKVYFSWLPAKRHIFSITLYFRNKYFAISLGQEKYTFFVKVKNPH